MGSIYHRHYTLFFWKGNLEERLGEDSKENSKEDSKENVTENALSITFENVTF